MTVPAITRDTLVAEALERVPNGIMLFLRHGFDPRINCGDMIHETTLGQAEWDCGLRAVDELIDKLNAQLESRPLAANTGKDVAQ